MSAPSVTDEQLILDLIAEAENAGATSIDLDELRRVADSMKWRPIATAPRDGSHILVCRGRRAGDPKRAADAADMRAQSGTAPEDLHDAFGMWFAVASWYRGREGECWHSGSAGEPTPIDIEPTHWRYLPDRPLAPGEVAVEGIEREYKIGRITRTLAGLIDEIKGL